VRSSSYGQFYVGVFMLFVVIKCVLCALGEVFCFGCVGNRVGGAVGIVML
jgi:hypothetical protein